MRRSSPVQQWLDSLPVETDQKVECQHELGSEQNTNRTAIESHLPELQVHDEKNLEVPVNKDMWKRKSLESGVLTSTPRVEGVKKKLQRDRSVQSEGYSPRLKNPLLRDCSLQVIKKAI